MYTIGYKTGFIHENLKTGKILVQVDAYAYAIEVKSIRAAKIMITKFVNKNKGS